MSDSANKPDKPTPHRLRKAREDGQFLSSKDLVSALQFVIFVMLLLAYTPAWFREAERMTIFTFRLAFKPDLGPLDMVRTGVDSVSRMLAPLGYAAFLLTLVALLAQFATTHFGFSIKKLKPSFKRMNPLTNVKELPGRNGPAAVQALAMMVIFGSAIWFVITDSLELLFTTPLIGTGPALEAAAEVMRDLFWKAAAVFLVFGFVDLARQFRKRQKELRMSRQDIKDEMKQNDGDPYIKARLQGIRREMLRAKMLKDVPTATAVIVNPTHYAVALRYAHGGPAAPVVVAKGRNHLALRIKDLARSRGVPIVENPPLAQALYKSVKVDQEIPPHLYRAVAEILAYVYKMMKVAEERPGRGPQQISRIL